MDRNADSSFVEGCGPPPGPIDGLGDGDGNITGPERPPPTSPTPSAPAQRAEPGQRQVNGSIKNRDQPSVSRAGRRLQPSATAAGHLAATTRLVPKDGAVGSTRLTRSRSRETPIRQQAACPTPEAVGAPPAQAAVPPASLSATPAEGSVEAPPPRTPASPAWRPTLPPVAPAWCPGDRWHEGGRQPVRPAPASGGTAHGPAPPPPAGAQRGKGKHQSAVPPRLAPPPGAEGGQRRKRAPATPPAPTPVVAQRSRPRVQPPPAPASNASSSARKPLCRPGACGRRGGRRRPHIHAVSCRQPPPCQATRRRRDAQQPGQATSRPPPAPACYSKASQGRSHSSTGPRSLEESQRCRSA